MSGEAQRVNPTAATIIKALLLSLSMEGRQCVSPKSQRLKRFMKSPSVWRLFVKASSEDLTGR